MSEVSYRYCHFPPAIIQHAVWLYCRFTLSFRDVEDLLAVKLFAGGVRLWELLYKLRSTGS